MVPNGFQHVTGLGNFPSDWIVESADELTSKITKGTTPPKSEIVEKSKTPFLRVNNLGFTGVLNSSSEILFVTKEAHEGFLARSIAYPNDILMNIVGPPLGKIAMLDSRYDEYNMNQAIIIYRTEADKVDQYYFLKFLGSELAQQWLQTRSKKTSGQQNLTIQLCKELPVPVPPIIEQRIIAKILSTWDKAISTTERLINNSKQQKKSLMQQLLTGKKRLQDDSEKPFEGDWIHGCLGSLCVFKGGSAFKEMYQGENRGDLPFIKVSDMNIVSNKKFIKEANNWVSKEIANSIRVKPFPSGSVVFAKVGAALLLNRRRILIRETIIDNNMMAAIPQGNCETHFFYQLMLAIDFAKFVQDGAVPSVNQSDLAKFKISYPSLEEQQKIATVLTSADKEIELLEQQLSDLKQEKKGLMQQLLTGKRRVKVDNVKVA
jgi:type I restriction enzyme S subunit